MSQRSIARPKRVLSSMALFAVLAAAGPANAQEGRAPERSAADALAPQIQRMHDVALAHRLAGYGRARSDAFALITAADMLLREPLAALDTRPDEAAGGSDAPPTALALLDEAQRLAAHQPPLLELIARLRDVAAATPRGAEGGIRTGGAKLPPLGTHRYEITFVGGQPAAVYIAGLHQAPIRCAVYDDGGKRVASDAGDDQCLVTWWPSRRASYRVEVRNGERVEAEYLFMTN